MNSDNCQETDDLLQFYNIFSIEILTIKYLVEFRYNFMLWQLCCETRIIIWGESWHKIEAMSDLRDNCRTYLVKHVGMRSSKWLDVGLVVK